MTQRLLWFLASALLVATGCSNPNRASESERMLSAAHVRDDSGFLPAASGVGVALEGVRVEYIDGPKAGSFAITGPDGSYRLVNPTTSFVHVRASKDGYESKTLGTSSLFGSLITPDFTLGQAPHTLWGDVRGGTPASPLDGVQVSILDGPNAGKTTMTDAAGRYRFDANVTSSPFNVRFTKAGYQSLNVLMGDTACVQSFPCVLGRNMQRDALLIPVG